MDTSAGIDTKSNINIIDAVSNPRVFGAVAGVAFAFILFIVTTILVYKRRKARRLKKEVIPFSDTPYSDGEHGKKIKQPITKYHFLF